MSIKYKGLKLIPSKTASKELTYYGLDIEDCKEILEYGYSPRKRKKDTEEKWLDRKNKTYNIVIVKSFNYANNEEVYLIKHIGKFTKKKIRRKSK